MFSPIFCNIWFSACLAHVLLPHLAFRGSGAGLKPTALSPQRASSPVPKSQHLCPVLLACPIKEVKALWIGDRSTHRLLGPQATSR